MSEGMRIGILGNGQLARMLIHAGTPLGLKFVVGEMGDTLQSDSPASAAPAHALLNAQGKPDPRACAHFQNACDVITYEFEHLPLVLVRELEQRGRVHPNSQALAIGQDRAQEKACFVRLGLPTSEYQLVHSVEELRAAAGRLGLPLVLKTCTEGYDGKGQYVLRGLENAEHAWQSLGHARLIAERFVAFSRELSLVAARSANGEMAYYPLVENTHEGGILRYTEAPARQISQAETDSARAMIRSLAEATNYVGVLCLELFESDGQLLINEMAPRVHNSGHWSQSGAPVSQFEQHIRAICGLPLAQIGKVRPTCMINLIGCDLPLRALLQQSDCQVHWYGKRIREGRKVGHINVSADDPAALHARVNDIIRLFPEGALAAPPF